MREREREREGRGEDILIFNKNFRIINEFLFNVIKLVHFLKRSQVIVVSCQQG